MSITPSVHFRNLIDLKRDQFSFAELSSAWSNIDGVTRLTRGLLTFFRDKPPNRDVTFDYGRLVLQRTQLSAKEAFDLIDAACNAEVTPPGSPGPVPQSQLQLAPWGGNEFQGLPNPIGSPRFVRWPARTFLLERINNQSVPVWNGPIVNTRLPLISDPQRSIDEFLGARLGRYPGNFSLAVFLPDYRARFKRVIISEEATTAEFEAGTVKSSRLMLRAAIDSQEVDGLLKTDWNSWTTILAGREVKESLEIFLLDRDSDDLIDWIQLRPGAILDYPEIEFASPATQIQRIVRLGEGLAQEFKQEPSDSVRLTQSVVAFANARGGTIFVGIDDSGKPHPFNITGARETIERKIRSDCDPYIRVEFESVIYDEVPLLIIKVPEGAEKPYVHKRNGAVLIRGGRTNFAATSGEIRDLIPRIPR